ncbi:hypothetical protein [Peribacillus sp. NPDC097895]|uniref:hypothetical protein n=1 Tax=Peribacillus sp. NPDC097895 TaxID=3390619 RepID=UPI003D07C475
MKCKKSSIQYIQVKGTLDHGSNVLSIYFLPLIYFSWIYIERNRAHNAASIIKAFAKWMIFAGWPIT